MLSEQELKQRLQEIANDDYAMPTLPELYPILLSIGVHIGSTDPELRDELIYSTLAVWIQRDEFEPRELMELLQVAMNDDHLFLGIGESGTDTVFTRSFSALATGELLFAHNKSPYIPDDEMGVIQTRLLRYLATEKDLRGYVPEKGWAHAVAHTADALGELVLNDRIDVDDLVIILNALRDKATTPDAVYIFEEDERLVSAVLHIWSRPELTDTQKVAWLSHFIPTGATADELPMPQLYHSLINSKTFLRSLHARVQTHPDISEPLVSAVAQTRAHFERFS